MFSELNKKSYLSDSSVIKNLYVVPILMFLIESCSSIYCKLEIGWANGTLAYLLSFSLLT